MSQQEPEEIRAEIDETRARLSRDVDTLAETAKPSAVVGRRLEAAKEAVGGAKEKIMGRAEDVGHRVGEHASGAPGQVSDKVARATQGVSETVGRAPIAVRSRTEGSPLAAGLAAFGIGFLAGSLLPASRAEQQAAEKLGEIGEPVRRELGDTARSVAQDVKSEATEAAQSLGESAKEAASAVTDAARHRSS